ncbi:MAG TPA: coniferyl-alcohol dehydrogenase [Myxococcota bacterium]|jgi:NAD(P)-dependent dehydrogenase (short-subunit alcohol dehydrogenase family)|nr:coniferyl-alcohol dehydrogenase [Myxococcota bacterium]
MRDILGYAGKQVVVSGAASGMGAAVVRTLVELGAEVHALDVKPVSAPVFRALEVDLRNRESIDGAVRRLPERVDRLFHCAGLPGAPFSNLDTMLVNFAALRHLTEALLPRIPSGGAVASITSVAGMGFRKNLENVKALCATKDFDEARAWCEGHPKQANGYLFSKQCIIWYTMQRAVELVARGIRMNCLSPAPTDTPMLPAFHAQVNREFIEKHFQAPVGRNATPEEMAEPLVFLNSDAARFVSGVNLFVDYGYLAAVEVGVRPALL